MRWPFPSRRERSRREAADWIARLNGPDGVRDRPAFEHWYRESPDHAAAFDRLSALFAAAGRAGRPVAADAGPSARSPMTAASWPGRYALAAAIAIVALLTCALVFERVSAPGVGREAQVASFAAPPTGARRIVLADGSEVLLSPGSAVDVALGRDKRRLRLLRGRAEFSVARESRPFTVSAGGAEVVARGTRFVVALTRGRATVALLEGRVDVSYVAPAGSADRRHIARLRPGQSLVVEPAGARAPSPGRAAVPRPASAPAMLEFDETPRGDAVEEVNRHGSPTIRLRDPALARLRITGAFRPGDTSGFAESIAAAFALEAERASDGTIWLKER